MDECPSDVEREQEAAGPRSHGAAARDFLHLAQRLSDKEARCHGAVRAHLAQRRQQVQHLGRLLERGADLRQARAALGPSPPLPLHAHQHLAGNLVLAMKRSVPLLPRELGDQVAVLLTPGALATTAGILGAWAALHAVGVGELIDLFLALYGVATFGFDMLRALRLVCGFVHHCQPPASAACLDLAAQDFADLVVLLGIDAVASLLLGQAFQWGHIDGDGEDAGISAPVVLGIGPQKTAGRLLLIGGLLGLSLAIYGWRRRRPLAGHRGRRSHP